MGAPLHNLSLVQHDDLVAVPDGAQPVGDNDAGNAPRVDGLDDLILGPRVQGAGGLVHDADGGVLAQGPGDLQPLPLPAAQVPSAVQQLVQEAAFPGHDVVIDARVPGRQRHLEVLDGVVPHFDVLAHRVLKQGNVLVDDRYGSGEHVPVDF